MARDRGIGGIGGIAFAVLTFAAFFVASPAGGTYKAADIGDFVAKGHRVAVIVATYLFLLGVAGLICLLARLRENIAGGAATVTDRIFWGTGLAAAAAFAVGWGIAISPALSRMYGGEGSGVPANVAYTVAEAGNVLIFGVGAILLGVALLALVVGAGATLPAWVRWTTALGAIAALASPAFFPFFLVLVWSLATGAWLLASRRGAPTTTAAGA
jgi:hypothetical protein